MLERGKPYMPELDIVGTLTEFTARQKLTF